MITIEATLPNNRFIVLSDGKKYTTDMNNYTCTCPANTHNSTGKIKYACKHIKFLEQLQQNILTKLQQT